MIIKKMKFNFSKKLFAISLILGTSIVSNKALSSTTLNYCIADRIYKDSRNGLVSSPTQLIKTCKYIDSYKKRYGANPPLNSIPVFYSIPVREINALYPDFW